MNDQDIIRKAVELADGWVATDHICHTPYGMKSNPWEDVSQGTLDALAAQLVRQVDATRRAWVDCNPVWTAVRCGEPLESGNDLGAAYGLDRTMNTLRAIVESKVLEEK